MSIKNNNNKVDLLGFQRSLNDQFLQIFESKKLGTTNSIVDSASRLGLVDSVGDFKFFLPLKELKNISMTNNFEEINLAKSWVCGFNQIRGEVFTILDLIKVIELIYSNQSDYQTRKVVDENRIIYLKKYTEDSVGLVINQLLLEYSAEYTPIFKLVDTENSLTWKLAEDIEFDSFIKEANMSKNEFKLINKINEFVKNKSSLAKEEVNNQSNGKFNENVFYSLIGDIYLDSMGKRPIFTLSIENLTKALVNVSTF